MKIKGKNQKGFTLMELMISTFVFVFITTIVLINFRETKKSDQLRISTQILASEIRRAQNMTQTGVVTDGVTSYGIYFDTESSYILFADSDPERNKIFDQEDEQVNKITLNNVNFDQVENNIIFIPPKPIICIGSDEEDIVCNQEDNFVITLTHVDTGDTREVIVQPLSGQISVNVP